MEMTLILYKKRKKHRQKIRAQKKFKGSIFLIASVMLKYIILAYHKKAKIEHCSIHFVHKKKETPLSLRWKAFKNIIQKRILQYEPARMAILVFLNIASVLWLINHKVLTVDFSYNYAKGEATEEKSIVPDNGGGKIDPQSFTKLSVSDKKVADTKEENEDIARKLNDIISSQEEKCQKDKEDGKCTELCVKNEAEIIAKMKEEEKQAWLKYLASRPKATQTVRLSCPEKNDGDPSYSETKGKHMDEDCCPDPDEWPKPGCVYDARGLALMLKGPRR